MPYMSKKALDAALAAAKAEGRGEAEEKRRYNGWVNYETWNVALWLGNEQGSDSYWREAAQEAWDDSAELSAVARMTGNEPFTREEKATMRLADRLKDEMEEANPLASDASMWSDLLSAALCEVNWRDIAEHYIADVDKTEEADDDGEE